MAKTVQKLKGNISRKLHSTNLDSVVDINSAIEEAVDNVLAQIDPTETIREFEITLDIDADRYDAPEDLKQDKILYVIPKVKARRGISDRTGYIQAPLHFLVNNSNEFSVITIDGQKSILYEKKPLVDPDDPDENVIIVGYYSDRAIRRSSDDEWIDEIDSDDDYFVFEKEPYKILLNECMMILSQQTQGEDSVFDFSYFRDVLFNQTSGLYPKYKNRYKSMAQRKRVHYY